MPPGWYDFHFGNWNENLVLTNAFHIDNPTVGIQEVEKSTMNIYPNPCTGKATLALNSNSCEVFEIFVTNLAGQLVKKLKANVLESEITLDLIGQPKGIYFVKTASEKRVSVQKLIIR